MKFCKSSARKCHSAIWVWHLQREDIKISATTSAFYRRGFVDLLWVTWWRLLLVDIEDALEWAGDADDAEKSVDMLPCLSSGF